MCHAADDAERYIKGANGTAVSRTATGSDGVAFAVAGTAGEGRAWHGLVVGAATPAVVAALAFVLSLGVRLVGLDLYSTTDEGYWMQRSVRFGAALARAATSRAPTGPAIRACR